VGEQVWLDGELVPAAAATVSVFDQGLTVGLGAFEALRAVDGVPFAARRHLDRLRGSCADLAIDLPWSDDDLRAAIASVVAGVPGRLARVRVTVTAGTAPLGPHPAEGPPTVVVAADPLAAAAPDATLCTVPWPRNERGALAGVKSTSYAENVLALAHARERGCTEAIFATTTGLLCEGAGSNVFLVHDGHLVTPTLTTGCLPGVTRALVLGCTDAEERDVPIEALAAAPEVFLTSTTRDVQPVRAVDGRDLGEPGPATRAAAAAFAALAAADPDP
jgi:branched-chain amino acid aminotransferase